MSTAKAEVESLLKRLPDSCTLEDVQYHEGGEYRIGVMNVREDSPAVHGISIKDHEKGIVSARAGEIVSGINIKVFYTAGPYDQKSVIRNP